MQPPQPPSFQEEFQGLRAAGSEGIEHFAASLHTRSTGYQPFVQVFCICSFILGVLLLFISKKFMKTILGLLGGLTTSGVLFRFIRKFSSISNGFIILAICGGVGTAVFVILRVYAKQLYSPVLALLFGFIVFLGKTKIEGFIQHETAKSIVPIVIMLLAAFIGGVIGLKDKLRKNTLKIMGAITGAFLVVSSFGYLLVSKDFIQTVFNLGEIIRDHNQFGQQYMSGETKRTDCAMMFVGLILILFSAIYQIHIQKSSKANAGTMQSQTDPAICQV